MTADEALERAIDALQCRYSEFREDFDWKAVVMLRAARKRLREKLREQTMPTNLKE